SSPALAQPANFRLFVECSLPYWGNHLPLSSLGRGTGALPMTKSDQYRAKAEECRVMAAKVTTPIDQAAWLELATGWLGPIPESAQTAAERFDAMEWDRGTRQQKSSAEH